MLMLYPSKVFGAIYLTKTRSFSQNQNALSFVDRYYVFQSRKRNQAYRPRV